MLNKTNKHNQWIDTHCHLFEQRFKAAQITPKAIYKLAITSQAKALINVGVDVKTSEIVIEQSKKFPLCFPAIGIHPHEADHIQSKDLDQFKKILNNNLQKIIAIGEIGLDYHYLNGTKKNQMQLLRFQLKLAELNNLPVLLHVRKAFDDLHTVLKDFQVTGIVHCFSGSLNDAKQLLKKGFKLSLSGVLTFKNATDLRALVQHLPLSSFVLETDAPYLAPQNKRGQINYPHYLLETAKTVAQIKNITLNQVLESTTKTAISILKLPT